MKKSQEELQGAQLKLSGPIATQFDELRVQLFTSQSILCMLLQPIIFERKQT